MLPPTAGVLVQAHKGTVRSRAAPRQRVLGREHPGRALPTAIKADSPSLITWRSWRRASSRRRGLPALGGGRRVRAREAARVSGLGFASAATAKVIEWRGGR